jgi:hypothetical protein
MSKPYRDNTLERTVWKNEQGKLHREDGPAIEYDNGHKSWWINNMCHRLDGPARIWTGGYNQWIVWHKELVIY